jgi:hypothetical protein
LPFKVVIDLTDCGLKLFDILSILCSPSLESLDSLFSVVAPGLLILKARLQGEYIVFVLLLFKQDQFILRLELLHAVKCAVNVSQLVCGSITTAVHAWLRFVTVLSLGLVFFS